MFVYDQEDFYFRKHKYISIIQSQMNNDELFCYLLNLIDYHYEKKEEKEKPTEMVKEIEDLTKKENENYCECLKNYDFFKDLVKSKEYINYIKALDPEILKRFISEKTLNYLNRNK